VKRVNTPWKIRKNGRKEGATLLGISEKGLFIPELVSHVQSHPERREKDKAKWDKDMWGNYIADRAASGDITSEEFYQWPNVEYYEIDAIVLLGEMGNEDMWAIVNEESGAFEMELLPEIILKNRAKEYRLNRDNNRAATDRGERAFWMDDTPEFAAKCYDQSCCSLASRAQGVRLLMDWGFHGGNRQKGYKLQADKDIAGKCGLCDQPDSLAHIIWGCVYGDMDKIRKQTTTELNSYVSGLRGIEQELGDAIRTLALEEFNNHLIWLGHWTEDLRTKLIGSCRILNTVLNEEAVRELKKVAIKIGRILAAGTRELWQYHNSQSRSEKKLTDERNKREKKRNARINKENVTNKKTAKQQVAAMRSHNNSMDKKKRKINRTAIQKNLITASLIHRDHTREAMESDQQREGLKSRFLDIRNNRPMKITKNDTKSVSSGAKRTKEEQLVPLLDSAVDDDEDDADNNYDIDLLPIIGGGAKRRHDNEIAIMLDELRERCDK